MAAFDLLGRRGTLRVAWELRGGDAFTFRALATASALPPATLNTRLREMRELGLIDAEEGYRLTALGQELLQSLSALDAWAKRWARTLSSSGA
jgi:DNA-binding HxlR family transcriptional regulator